MAYAACLSLFGRWPTKWLSSSRHQRRTAKWLYDCSGELIHYLRLLCRKSFSVCFIKNQYPCTTVPSPTKNSSCCPRICVESNRGRVTTRRKFIICYLYTYNNLVDAVHIRSSIISIRDLVDVCNLKINKIHFHIRTGNNTTRKQMQYRKSVYSTGTSQT